MSLFHAKRLFDDAIKQLGATKNDLSHENHAALYDVVLGLSALSDGLEKEATEIKAMLANIHQALISAKGPESE